MSDQKGEIVPKEKVTGVSPSRWKGVALKLHHDEPMFKCFHGRSAGLVLALILGAGSSALAQLPDQGLRVEGLSLSETYLSQRVPRGITTYNDVFLGSGTLAMASATIKFTRVTPKSFLLVRALPTYGGLLRVAKTRRWDQAWSFSYSRVLGRKWTLSWFGSAQLMSFEDALFAESTLTQIASTEIGFENLTGAIFQGKSSDPELNGIAQGAFHPDRGLENFLLGRRTASAALSGALTYAYSPRLLLSVVSGSNLTRHLTDSSDPPGIYYPKLNSASVGINGTYSLSPRTQVGASANVTGSELASQAITTNALSGFINRTMSRRWFAQASLGLGSETSGGDRHLNNRFSVGLGFKTLNQTALVVFDRGFDDPYDFANAALEHNRTLTGSWHYARPGGVWWATTSATQLIAIYRGVPGTDSWGVSQAVGRRISRNYSVLVQYTAGRLGAKRYIQDGRQYQLEQTGVRASFIWAPQKQVPIE